ncbi:acyltransferase [Verrucomicrobiales bacterium]|jgi:peptidoglycan/LPS O-acetylase OafA/YrhL|nr:acyltransferase [Verrucomicrobiales bacterium]
MTESKYLNGDSAVGRVYAIDFTKGTLVVFMVLYHAFNYSTQYYLGFKYLAFLPPSFIFITGFLIARVYFRRDPSGDVATSVRMVIRGLKLFAIFTALNLGVILLGTRSNNGQPLSLGLFLDHWREIYLSGAGTLVVFDVLIPIAYLLLAGPILLFAHRCLSWSVPILATLVIAGLSCWEVLGNDIFSNVSMVAAGFLGAAVGTIPQRSLDAIGRFWYIPIVAYGALYCIGTRFEAYGNWVFAQQVAAAVAVAVLYAIGSHFRKPEWVMQRVVVLGNYSLLAYIVQIGFLQILVRWTGRLEPDRLAFVTFFLVVLLLTTLSAEIARWLRANSRLADDAYRLIFG